jgi:hypothetical protein
VRRKRYQEGSLQVRSHGKRKMWVVLYRDAGVRKYYTVGLHSKMSKSQAQEKQAEFMKEVNLRQAQAPDPNMTFGDFLEGVALPFYRSKWKRSTAGTTESRIRHHLLEEFGPEKLSGLTLKPLQAFLSTKAATFSRSIVAQLRWDLTTPMRVRRHGQSQQLSSRRNRRAPFLAGGVWSDRRRCFSRRPRPVVGRSQSAIRIWLCLVARHARFGATRK